MKQTLSKFLEILFPMRKDSKIVSTLTEDDLLHIYVQRESDNIVWLLSFDDTRVRACIHEVKFHENHIAAKLLAATLREYIKTHEEDTFVIIPVPLSNERHKKRKHNQVQTIASYVKHVPVEMNILKKVKDTVPQTTLTRSERLKNVKGVFAVKDLGYNKEKFSGKHIILLDDVFTTGATLNEARDVFSQHNPASITCVALAH
ncbi:phosphoribosyltransferase family protein [Candidatus Pacebacteria bacterium]|nr:phosphoribosyltransferase family protein [Candidatus Paceibacterota bacterium]